MNNQKQIKKLKRKIMHCDHIIPNYRKAMLLAMDSKGESIITEAINRYR